MQITIIGGGSYQWAPTLIVDLLRTESIRPLRLVLEDIDPDPLPTMEAFAKLARRQARHRGRRHHHHRPAPRTRGRRLRGRDHLDRRVRRRCASISRFPPATASTSRSATPSARAASTGRCATSRCSSGIGKDMEEVCPDAWMLNITNPMTSLTRSVCRETSHQDRRALPRGRQLLARPRHRLGHAAREDAADGGRGEPLPGHHRTRRERHRRARAARHDGRRPRRLGHDRPRAAGVGARRSRGLLRARLREAPLPEALDCSSVGACSRAQATGTSPSSFPRS